MAVVITLVAGLSGCSAGQTTVTAQFKDAAGLFEGNDVGVLGVKVGEVTRIVPRGDHVNVTLAIDPEVKIPADVGAVVVSRSVATDRYIELTPVYNGGPTLASGAVLSMQRTRTPVEFDALLGSLRTISDDLAAGDSKPLNRALHSTAAALDGNGARIAGALSDLATTLEAANASSGDFAATVRNLDTFAAALADNDKLAREFTSDVADATSLVDDEKESLEKAFTALAQMVRKVAAFVRAHRGQITHQIDDIDHIVNALVGTHGDFAELLETMPLALQNGARAVDDKGHLSFLTRPGDFVPTEAGFAMLCSHFPAGSCDPFAPGATHLFELFRLLAGAQ